MDILVVSQYFWPENFRVNDLVTELCQRGHRVTVLTGYPNYPSGTIFADYQAAPERFRRYGDAPVERVPMLPRGSGSMRLILNYLSFALSAALLGSWRLRGRAFDALFVFEPSPITVGLPAVLLRRLKRAPLSFWVLDLWPETLEAIGAIRSPWILRAVGRMVRFIYQRCDLILAQSKSFIPQIRRYCPAGARVEYFPSWSDAGFHFSSVKAAPEVPTADGVFSVMFAGNIGEAQDFPAILDAAEATQGDVVRWLIVGDGRVACWAREEVRRRGLEKRVLFFGQHPVERMPSFFKHADALLVSLKDSSIFAMTIPGKLQSYLAAGIPILAMLNGEGAEIVSRAGAGLACAAGDGLALARNVRAMASMSPEDRAMMGRRGLEVYASEFERNLLISRLIGWFDELRSTPSPATVAR